MEIILGGSDGTRTMIFPEIVVQVRQGAFHEVDSLRKVILDKKLNVLGVDEYAPDGRVHFGVFEGSGLRCVELSPTLSKIEYRTFAKCRRLKNIRLPDGL